MRMLLRSKHTNKLEAGPQWLWMTLFVHKHFEWLWTNNNDGKVDERWGYWVK